MIERDDESWLRELGGSDPARSSALSDLRARLLANVRAAWAGRSGCADDALIEDAVQNALVQILNKLASFAGTARFLSWATTVAVHAVITEMRRRRWEDVSLEDAVRSTGSPIDSADGTVPPESRAARGELLALLDRLIRDELTDRQREAILAELNGLPLEEIGRRMGVSRNAIYKLTHDARRRLKASLEAAGYFADDLATLWADPAVE